MNDTVSRIKAEAERRREANASGKSSSEEQKQRLSEAAEPLVKAFADVQNTFVRIDVLKRIWPEDYLRRPDQASGLLVGFHGGEHCPSGLSLHIPGGRASFEVEETWDGKLTYTSTRETMGSRPRSWKYDSAGPWLDDFFQLMATLLEI
jgi:hypothetical protein